MFRRLRSFVLYHLLPPDLRRDLADMADAQRYDFYGMVRVALSLQVAEYYRDHARPPLSS